MSLILKGIDLPKHCKAVEVKFYISDIDVHRYVYEEYNREVSAVFTGETLDNVIQIPKRHGRLIDIEKLKEEFAMKNNICKECDSFKKCDNKTYSKSEICEKFIWVPTILEAEEIK